MPEKKAASPNTSAVQEKEVEKKFNKQEIIYSAIVEKELLHNGLVQRETLKTLKELNATVANLTAIIQSLEQHQFLTIHRKKWKIVLYNLSMGILFAIGTVFGLLLLSWSTYIFFKDSPQIKDIIDSQLKLRHFDLSEIKAKAEQDTQDVPQDISTKTSTGKKK